MFGAVTRDAILGDLTRLPVFPKVINLLLGALDNQASDIATLSHHIKSDAVLTGRLLAQTNLLLRDMGREPVGDAGTAISLIGFERLRSLVLMTTLRELNSRLAGSDNSWSHSLAVGVAAQELARILRTNTEWAMVAGLLHDVGQLWLRHFAPERYQRVLRVMEAGNLPIADAELRVFGIDHGEVGAIIAEAWALPDEIVLAVRNHHASGAHAACDRLCAIVHLSETIANALDLPFRNENEVATLSTEVFECLGLAIDDSFVDLLGRVQARHRYAEALFAT